MSRLHLACILLAIAGLFPCIINAAVERYQAELRDGEHEGDRRFLSCSCEQSTETEPLDEETATAVLKGKLRLAHCTNPEVGDVCGLLLLCSECIIRHSRCYTLEEAKKVQCLDEIHLLNDNYFGLRDRDSKDIITIEHARVKRNALICTYPSHLKTADVACKTSGNLVTCTQACIFGHTLGEGVIKTLSCKKTENVWKPSGFVECEPFVDCSLSLRTPGTVDCYSGTTRTAPLCYVSCNQFEDRAAVPRRAYECTLSGTWNRPLPFCITTGSGIHLVPRPKNFATNQVYSK